MLKKVALYFPLTCSVGSVSRKLNTGATCGPTSEGHSVDPCSFCHRVSRSADCLTKGRALRNARHLANAQAML
jgi:hypothetical protein